MSMWRLARSSQYRSSRDHGGARGAFGTSNANDLLEGFTDRWGDGLTLTPQPTDSPYSYSIVRSMTRCSYNGEIDSIRIRFMGRWGNYVLQMLNVFHLAEIMSVKRVYLLPTEVFPMSRDVKINGIEIRNARQPSLPQDCEMEGQFFFSASLGRLLDGLTANRRRELARRYVQPLMTALTPRTDLAAEADLLIHVRSGDIFEGEDGQGGTGVGGSLMSQPPAAFYKMAADAAFEGGRGRISLVAENALNPIILPLIGILDKLGHKLTVRLNQSLNTDLSWMLGVRKVAFAHGTFGVAAAILSEALEDAFFFRHDCTGTYDPVGSYVGDHVRKHVALDSNNTYLAFGDWRNTPEQRATMCEFSEEQIKWNDDSFVAPVNVALNKPARQSSLSVFSRLDESKNAVNGKKTGGFSFHTNDDQLPWWEVDLLTDYQIKEVVVYNRLQMAERASGMQIFGRQIGGEWRLLHDQRGRLFGGVDGHPARIDLRGEIISILRIQLPSPQFLHLDEVEVFA